MRKSGFVVLAIALLSVCCFAVDGVVLINQATVMAAGGFPYTISQPGSYKLSGNLVAPAGVNGVVIAASNVTVDLNGFRIEAPQQTCSSLNCASLVGIGMPLGAALQTAISVKNGMVRGFGLQVNLFATYSHADDLILLQGSGGNTSSGAAFQGSSTIHRVTSDGVVVVGCPSVVAESLAQFFLQSGSPGTCVFTGSSGTVL